MMDNLLYFSCLFILLVIPMIVLAYLVDDLSKRMHKLIFRVDATSKELQDKIEQTNAKQ